MKQYLGLMNDVLNYGDKRDTRSGKTRSLFGKHLMFDLSMGFPLITTKKVYLKGLIHELLWCIKGDTNIKYLNDNNVHIWDKWANKNGDLGPVYGAQWRNFNGIDQLSNLLDDIKKDPFSRRLILNSWNVSDLDKMALPPCPMMVQYYIQDGRLDSQVYQRSADIFLGLPFDIAEYALLQFLIAKTNNLNIGMMYYCIGDAHLYELHINQAEEQLNRCIFPLATLKLANKSTIFDYKFEDIEVQNYQCWPVIKAKVCI